MLRISKKGDYAVFIMGYLAQYGAHGAERIISAQEIADHSGLHKSVVANLLKELTKAGLLESVRGLRGGYRLALPAEQISLARILEVVEGPFVLVDCAESHAGSHAGSHEGSHEGSDDPSDGHGPARVSSNDEGCSLVSFCPSKQPMRVLHQRIAQLLEDLKLPELVGYREQKLPVCPAISSSFASSR